MSRGEPESERAEHKEEQSSRTEMDTKLSAPQWAPTQTQTPPTTSKYLFRPTVVTSTAASSLSPVVLALHCPAGTGATVYNGWVAAFKAAFLEDPDPIAGAVHLVPIELPGRGLRTKETLRTTMEDLASEIAAALEGYVASISSSTVDSAAVVPPRLCVLGHSLGGWIGFEVFRKLRHQALSCCCMIASGIRSPTLCGVDNDIDGTAMHELDEAAFWEAMERRYGVNKELEHPSVRRWMWPVLKADFTVSETYSYTPNTTKLEGVSVYVSGGRDDVRIDEGRLEAWREVMVEGGDGVFEVQMFDGGHHYLFSDAESMEEHVRWVIVRLKDSLRRLERAEKGGEGEEGGAGDEETHEQQEAASVLTSDCSDGAGYLELRTDRSERASLVSEMESSTMAHPGTTQTLSEVDELARDIVAMNETIDEIENKESAARRTSTEPRCAGLCSVM